MKFCSHLLLLLMVLGGYGFAVEGNWKVTDVATNSLSHQLTLSIEDYIFRNTSIRWTMAFDGCHQWRYIIEFQEDNLYVDFESYGIQRRSDHGCSEEELNIENDLRRWLKRCFKFQILSSYMFFSDVTGTVLLKFQRLSGKHQIDLEGLWKIQRIYSQKTSQLLQISNNTITFCLGKASLKFEIVAKNQIEVIEVEDNGCGSQQFISAMGSIAYFRRIKNSLSFFSKDVETVLSTQFYLDLETAAKEEEERQKRIEEEERKKAQLSQQRRQEILRQRELERQRLQEQKQIQQIKKLIPELTNTKADLMGKWKIKKIFGIPLPIDNFQLIIAEDQMILSGGCNTHILGYNEEESVLTTGQLRSTKNICANDEDGLYKTALIKVHKYQAMIDDEQIVVEITDSNDGKVFQLRRNATLVSIQTETPQPQEISQPVQPQVEEEIEKVPEIVPGKYMILLLFRRDLPRRLSIITQETISFKACNNITFSYVADEGSSISLTVEDKMGASADCDLKRQDPYIEYLSESKAFRMDGEDIMLMDGEGKEVVNLNKIG